MSGNHVTRSGGVYVDRQRIGNVRKKGSKWVAELVDGGLLDALYPRQADAVMALQRQYRRRAEEAAARTAAAQVASQAAQEARRARGIQSGWCESGRHGRCSHLLQAGNGVKREVVCSCRCHRLTRRMAWAQQR